MSRPLTMPPFRKQRIARDFTATQSGSANQLWTGINWAYLWTSDLATPTSWPATIGGVTLSREGTSAQLVNGLTTGLTTTPLNPGMINHGAVPVSDGSMGGWGSTSKLTLTQSNVTFRLLVQMSTVNGSGVFYRLQQFFGSGPDYYVQYRYNSSGGFTLFWNEQGSTNIDSHIVPGLFGGSSGNFPWILLDVYTTVETVTSRWNGTAIASDTNDTAIDDIRTNGNDFDFWIGSGNNGNAPNPGNTIMAVGIAYGDIGASQHLADATALGINI